MEGCSGLENPTGIETIYEYSDWDITGCVAADLKTRQGLKHGDTGVAAREAVVLQRT